MAIISGLERKCQKYLGLENTWVNQKKKKESVSQAMLSQNIDQFVIEFIIFYDLPFPFVCEDDVTWPPAEPWQVSRYKMVTRGRHEQSW